MAQDYVPSTYVKVRESKVQGYICLATPHPTFAVASELASLKQRMLRTLTPAAALYARQLMPF